MFAQQTEIAEFDGPMVVAENDVRPRLAPPEPVWQADDELAPARGVALGLLLGLLSIALVAGAVWWAI